MCTLFRYGTNFAHSVCTLSQKKVQEFFAQDVDPAEANILAVGTAIIQSIIAEKSGPPAWKQLPTWY